MSSYTRELQQKAKEKANQIVRRAAKDGKIRGSEFEKLERDSWYTGPINSANSSYVANAIARELRRNPQLAIGKKASDVTGVKLKKDGTLIREPSDRVGFLGLNEDPGSDKWVQNSRGRLTYLGNIPDRVRQKEVPDSSNTQTPSTPAEFAPSEDLINAANSGSGGRSAAGAGSIHFNPGEDMIAAVSDYGNRATDDYFNRFIPDLKNQSILQGMEIGESMGFHIGRLAAKPPELGDAKDLYKWYSKRLG